MTMSLNPNIQKVLDRIREKSSTSRQAYLARIERMRTQGPNRNTMGCSNLAHGFAACGASDKQALKGEQALNIGVVSAYNDMLSAHQPMRDYPDWIKEVAREHGAVAQLAGGVPAMCDGVTQGYEGMELSLFSRDVIAQSTAIALSHNMFDAAICLGTCDKIVPGLMMGALAFGHLPIMFSGAGPMPSGISNGEKAAVREQYAKGEVGRAELLESESAAYHAPGTCTFYGTANSNQMLMEIMGVHAPGTTFLAPGSDAREAAVRDTARKVLQHTDGAGEAYRPFGQMIDERSFVNAIVGLMATGGSTNLTMHLVAMAAMAGIRIDWQDMSEISAVVPLLARVYPNGSADVNAMEAAGGLPYLFKELARAELLCLDAVTMSDGSGTLRDYLAPDSQESGDLDVLRPSDDPFHADGGLRLLAGNLGRGVIKTSAIAAERHVIQAPAIVFDSQGAFQEAYKRGDLAERDFVAVVRFQGPKANGMPELHKLTPPLAVMQSMGQKVALVTDGRMSGASGKVPAAIHVCDEALDGGPLAYVQDGDIIRLDAVAGTLEVKADLSGRQAAHNQTRDTDNNFGRGLFAMNRQFVGSAEAGAMSIAASV